MTNRIRDWFNSAPNVPWIGRFAIAAFVAVVGLWAVAMAYFLHYGDDGWTDAHRSAASNANRRPTSTTQSSRTDREADVPRGDTSGCRLHATIDELLMCATENSEAELNAAGRLARGTSDPDVDVDSAALGGCDEAGDAGPTLPTAHLGSDWTTYRPEQADFSVALELPDGWTATEDPAIRSVVATNADESAALLVTDVGASARPIDLPQLVVDEFGGDVRLLGTSPDVVNGVDACRSRFEGDGLIIDMVSLDIDGHTVIAGATWSSDIPDDEIDLARTTLASIDLGGVA
jgi:hypothetical protein